ncbi:MAG: hypothetical protein ACTSQI_12425 [Candidatus Helarchaeota archaeon]
MTKISNESIRADSKLPRFYFRFVWLLGQFIQHSLLSHQGIRVPDPPELKSLYPNKTPTELINIQRELYGCKFNWNTGALVVSYGENNFDITLEAQEIVAKNVDGKITTYIAFDTHGFDFNRACLHAETEIINQIKNGQKVPL